MHVKIWVKKMVDNMRAMSGEDYAVTFFGATFFVGVWYAFPMVNTITDVWAFGGGVLRAMEAHSLLPGYGVAYGTISFYQNYIAMIFALCAALPFYGFDVEALKTALVLNPAYSLMVPRVVSVLSAIFLLVFVHRFLKLHVHFVWWRFALIVLVFGNVLTALLTRSGKMWMLSIGLGVVSFVYLYRALTEEREVGKPDKWAALSIIAAFLATANFSFAGIFLVNILILLFAFPRTAESFRRLVRPVVLGGILFLVFFTLNAENTIRQLSEFILPFFDHAAKTVSDESVRLTLFMSFMVNMRQAIEVFPLLILAAAVAYWGGVRDQLLARLALFYLSIYLFAVAFIFRTDQGLALNIRHIFPLGFFLMFFIAAHKPPTQRIAVAFFTAGLCVYLFVVFLFSVPTTYNAASDFIAERYGEMPVRIDENIFELTLPMNKASYGLLATSSCGSACIHTQSLPNDISFRPIVVTGESDAIRVANMPPADLIVVDREISGCIPIARFGNTVPDDEVFDIDINLGRMFMTSFYRLERLGKNLYLYDAKFCGVSGGTFLKE